MDLDPDPITDENMIDYAAPDPSFGEDQRSFQRSSYTKVIEMGSRTIRYGLKLV